MKKKKGFTLIELLGVIVIIGLLLTIAVPAVQKYLKRGKRAYYTSIEGEMKAAGMDYMETYKTLLPTVIGNSSVVELDELVLNKYIDEVKDEKGNLCTGQVKITKEKKNQYKYESCLDCNKYYTTTNEGCNFVEKIEYLDKDDYIIDPVCPDKDNCDVKICDENNNCSDPSTPVCTPYTPGCLVELDVPASLVVDQGIGFLKMPYAKVKRVGDNQPYFKSDLEGVPAKVDTSKLGTVKVVYNYHGQKRIVTVTVVDRKNPTQPNIALRKEELTGEAYINEWYSGNIMAIFKSTDYVEKGLLGSGVKEYQVYPGTEKEVVAPTESTVFKSLLVPYELVEKEGEYTRYVRSVDKSGNIGDYNQYTYRIDKTNPPAPTITINGTPKRDNIGRLWFNAEKVPVTVTFTHNGDPAPSSSVNKTSGVKKIEYILSQATILTPNKYTEIAHEGTINLTNDGVTTVKAKVTDNADNVSLEASSNVYIDTVAPKQATIKVSGTHGDTADPYGILWYRSDITVTLSYTEEVCPQFGCSGVEKMTYKLTKDTTKGGQETTNPKEVTIPNNGTITINQDGKTTITVYVYDYAGNRSEISKTVGRDTVKPPKPTVVKTSGNPVYNNEWHNIDNESENGKYKTPVIVRVTASSDPMSETYVTNFKKRPEPTTSLNGEDGNGLIESPNNIYDITFTKSGVTKVTATTTDYAGNISDEATLIIKMDRSAPQPATIEVSSGTKTLQSSKWYTSNSVKVRITQNGDTLNNQTLSGYKEMKYELSGAQTQSRTSISNNGEVEITRNGTTTVTAYVYDNVGNVSTNTFNVYLDNQKPNKPSITITPTSSKTTYYSGDISARIDKSATTDAHSGFGKVTYSFSGSQTKAETTITSGSSATINKDGTTTVTAYEYDAAGNRSDPETATVYRDTVVPTTTITTNVSSTYSNDWYKSDVTATIKCSDDRSGPKTIYYKINNGSYTSVNASTKELSYSSGQTTISAYCTDIANNRSADTSKKIKIDKTAPSCTPRGGNTSWKKSGPIIYTYECGDDGSGCYGTSGSICSQNYNPTSTTTTLSNQIAGSTCYAIDNAGNTTSCPKFTANIYVDPVAPTASLSITSGTSGSARDGSGRLWYRTDVGLSIGCTDDTGGTGCNSYSYTVTNGNSTTGTSNTFTVTKEGTNSISAYAYDKVNNQSRVATNTVYIDKTGPNKPSITVTGTKSGSNYVDTATVSISGGSDGLSGIWKYQYKVGASGTWTDYSTALSYSAGSKVTIYARAVDYAGNIGAEENSGEINVITISYSTVKDSTGSYDITVGDPCEGATVQSEHAYCQGSSDCTNQPSGTSPRTWNSNYTAYVCKGDCWGHKLKCHICGFEFGGDDDGRLPGAHDKNGSHKTTTGKVRMEWTDSSPHTIRAVVVQNAKIKSFNCTAKSGASPATCSNNSCTLPTVGKEYTCTIKYTVTGKSQSGNTTKTSAEQSKSKTVKN